MKKLKKPSFSKIGLHHFQQANQSTAISTWFGQAKQDRLLVFFVVVWSFMILFSTIYSAWNFPSLPDQVPLFYSRPWGQMQLATKINVFVPIFGVLLLGILNFSLAIAMYAKDKILAYLLAGAASLTSFLCSLTVVNIVNLMR